MQIQSYVLLKTGMSFQAVFLATPPLVQIRDDGDGQFIYLWNVPGVPQPSADDVKQATSAPEPIFLLANEVIRQASRACDVVTNAVVPDQVHQVAYSNALSIVGPTATVPTVDPLKTAFQAMAAANGFAADPQDFANLAVAVASASLTLSAALTTVEVGVVDAQQPSDLALVVSTFETTITRLVDSLNASSLTITIPPPPVVSVKGVNA